MNFYILIYIVIIGLILSALWWEASLKNKNRKKYKTQNLTKVEKIKAKLTPKLGDKSNEELAKILINLPNEELYYAKNILDILDERNFKRDEFFKIVVGAKLLAVRKLATKHIIGKRNLYLDLIKIDDSSKDMSSLKNYIVGSFKLKDFEAVINKEKDKEIKRLLEKKFKDKLEKHLKKKTNMINTKKKDFVRSICEKIIDGKERIELLDIARKRLKELNDEHYIDPSKYVFECVEAQFTCKKCEYDNPVNSLRLDQKCHYCQTPRELKKEEIHKTFSLTDDWDDRNILYTKSTFAIDSQNEKWEDQPPNCYQCGTQIKESLVLESGEHEIECPKCGTYSYAYTIPEYLKRYKPYDRRNYAQYEPIIVFGTEPMDAKSKKSKPNAEKTEDKKTTTISFKCSSCSANLKIDKETPRVLTCKYCNTDQYLPDDLWLRLHSVPLMDKKICVKLKRVNA